MKCMRCDARAKKSTCVLALCKGACRKRRTGLMTASARRASGGNRKFVLLSALRLQVRSFFHFRSACATFEERAAQRPTFLFAHSRPLQQPDLALDPLWQSAWASSSWEFLAPTPPQGPCHRPSTRHRCSASVCQFCHPPQDPCALVATLRRRSRSYFPLLPFFTATEPSRVRLREGTVILSIHPPDPRLHLPPPAPLLALNIIPHAASTILDILQNVHLAYRGTSTLACSSTVLR